MSSDMTKQETAQTARSFSEIIEANGTIVADLAQFDGARLRARRTVQDFSDVIQVEGSRDHTLVFHLGGGTQVERYYGEQIDEKIRQLRTTTLHPAYRPSGWRASEPVEVLHIYPEDHVLRGFAEQDLDIDGNTVEVLDRMGVVDPFMQGLAPLILHEMASPYVSSKLMLDSLDMVIAGHVLRAYTNLTDRGRAPFEQSPGRLSQSAINRLQSYITENLAEPISLDDLSGLLQMPLFQFSREFKAGVGVPPHQYVLQARIERVRDLLTNTDLPLADIAYACGFSSQAHMTSTFTKHHGISPGRYRREVRT